MRGASRTAALALRGMFRKGICPGRQTRSASATSQHSPMSAPADRLKHSAKFDISPFAAARAPRRLAETVLLFLIPGAGLISVLAALYRQVM